jgi:hypothetical protein
MQAFKPDLIVIMGRSREFLSGEERITLKEQLRGVRLCTFDELIEYGRSRAVWLPDDLSDRG